jgi:hypothetical protein
MEELADLTRGEHRFVSLADLGGRTLPPNPANVGYRLRMLLSLAQSLERQGKHTAAARRYGEIARQHPGTEEAAIALERLQTLDPP